MKHLELLNPNVAINTHTNPCEGDNCYRCDGDGVCNTDCGCDTYICVDVCGIDIC